MVWPALKAGGLMLLDDYEWPVRSAENPYNPVSLDDADHPKRGIDAFLETHKEELSILHKRYQVLVKKKTSVTAYECLPPESASQRISAGEGDNKEAGSVVAAAISHAAATTSTTTTATLPADAPHTTAVLLPITSRDVKDPVSRLKQLALCLPPPQESLLCIGVDEDDPVYTATFDWNQVFPEWVQTDHLLTLCFKPCKPARIWPMTCELAKEALKHKAQCSLFCLLGDDVTIECQKTTGGGGTSLPWWQAVRQEFDQLHARQAQSMLQVPWGFGVVALSDRTFPGFPTFPVVGRVHLNIFQQLVPASFINQDGDPYLWEIYRRFGAVTYAAGVSLHNGIGGDESRPCRYERTATRGWKDKELQEGVQRIVAWLEQSNPPEAVQAAMHLCMDVLVPSFRCPVERLCRIISLPQPPNSDVQFVVILDDPEQGPQTRKALEHMFAERVRVRCNETNSGASYSRNRALDESSADWVVFLDDDVEPEPSVLLAYAQYIRTQGDDACGFAGLSKLPAAHNLPTKALRMSYLLYFWGVACLKEGGDRAPWAVTANVCSRRTTVRFDDRFPKTGGGEDIDYLQRVMQATKKPLLKAPAATITHPWWNEGVPDPCRFYGWASGDSRLTDADKFPQHVYWSWPSALELCYFLLPLMAVWCNTILCTIPNNNPFEAWIHGCLACMCSILLTDALLEVHRVMITDPAVESGTVGVERVIAAFLSTVYKGACDVGHFKNSLQRGSYTPLYLCRRFDWWMGMHPPALSETRKRECRRTVWMLLATIATCLWSYNRSFPFPALLVTLLTGWYSAAWLWIGTTKSTKYHRAQTRTPQACDAALTSKDSIACVSSLPPLTVCFICDDAYIKALGTCLQSIVESNTLPCAQADVQPVQQQVYRVIVVDVGIQEHDWQQLQQHFSSTALQLERIKALDAPSEVTTCDKRSEWVYWSKVWLDKLLPVDVQSVLLLDCDTIVRSPLLPLWQEAMSVFEQNAHTLVAAVVDCGEPRGAHLTSLNLGWESDWAYFNAGVVVLTLQGIRAEGLGDAMRCLCRSDCARHKTQRFLHKDQDVLNVVLHGRWYTLDFRWNMQGAGTYADYRTRAEPGRPALFSDSELSAIIDEAHVVHFTGTAKPTLADFLSRHAREPTKPWAFFCHHPYTELYWELVSRSPFSTWSPQTLCDRHATQDMQRARDLISGAMETAVRS